MDADLRAFDASEAAKEERAPEARVDITNDYLWPLVGLGDRRIAPVVVERFTPPPSLFMRSQVAALAHQLGLEEPLRALAEEIRRGPDAPSDAELEQWLRVIIAVVPFETPEVNAALEAVLRPGHSLYAALWKPWPSSSVGGPGWPGEKRMRAFYLKTMRVALDDTTPTKKVARLENGKHIQEYGNGSSSFGTVPNYLKPSAAKPRTVQLRRWDEAAEGLSSYHGLPFYDPLLLDAPQRLERLRSVFDHYRQNYLGEVPEPNTESLFPSWPSGNPAFPLLGRSATADDVAAGRAIFDLNGQGKPAPLVLPAVARWKGGDQREQVRIVQAEIDARGQTTYGIIDEYAIRKATPGELTDIESYTAVLEREAKDRAEWERED